MKRYKEIYLSKKDNLADKITEKEKCFLTHLKISGYIKSKDFDVLDSMTTSWGEFDEDDNFIIYEDEPPFLKVLDLGECIKMGAKGFGDFTFHSKLEKIILPKNLKTTSLNFAYAFENSVYLKEVILNNTLKEIGDGSFINCERLTDIELPQSLETICSYAFSGCGFKKVYIPKNVSTIVDMAFPYCNQLKSFEVSSENKNFIAIEGILFSSDKTKLISFPAGSHLKEYKIPEGTKIIADGAFAGCKLRKITLPNSLVEIGRSAFRACEKLEELIIPDTVFKIGGLAFSFCFSLKKVQLPSNLKVIEEQIFSSCPQLKKLIIPTSVKIIKERALCWSNALEELILNEGLEEINDDLRFTNIKKLFIPKTVRKIQSGLAILGSAELNRIQYEVSEENAYFCASNGSLYDKTKTRLISVFPTNKNQFTVPDGVQIIEDFVFANFDLEQINLPNTITTIKHRCFENCLKLRTIKLPASLKQIDFRAFDNCENLESIEITAVEPPKITDPSANIWKFAGDAKNLSLYIPKESKKKYKKAFGWKDVKNLKILDAKTD